MSKKNEFLGNRLRFLRGDRPQHVVAAACGIGTSTLAMYEAGLRIPRDDIKVVIANYFNKTVQDIFFSDKELSRV